MLYNYKVGQFIREQSLESERNPGYGDNRADKVNARSMSYLEKTIKKVGIHSYVSNEDLPDESPVPSASMTMMSSQQQSVIIPSINHRDASNSNPFSPKNLPDSTDVVTPKPLEPRQQAVRTSKKKNGSLFHAKSNSMQGAINAPEKTSSVQKPQTQQQKYLKDMIQQPAHGPLVKLTTI